MKVDEQAAIETSGLTKLFGATRAVDGVDLRGAATGVYGVLGPNGAGKTTTIRMLATLLRPDAGSARVFGHDVVHEAEAVRQRISLTGQFASVDEDLTGVENLVLLGRLLGFSGGSAARRAASCSRRSSSRRRRTAGQDLLRRHAAPPRHRRQHRGGPAAAVPRRADHRTRPAQPERGVAARPHPRRRRHHGPADHAVSRRGRPARRPHRGDRPRRGRRRGDTEAS